MTDTALATRISSLLRSKSVASFGDGPGFYREYMLKLGQVKCYDAFDGAPYVKETTNDEVKFLDLSVPIYHLDKYDWVISLEVAEHIPAEFEHIFIDNLVRHAKEGIILSWAKLGQGGHSHINNRDFSYVKEQMELRNLRHDPNLSGLLKNASSLSWLRENINVFLK